MKSYNLFILIFILLFLSCEEDSFSICNTQDPLSDCYLPYPDSTNILSYSPTELILNFDNINDVDSILVNRKTFEYDDVLLSSDSLILSKNSSNIILDDNNILLNKTYKYSLRNINNIGVSDSVSSFWYHDFPSVLADSFFINVINEGRIDLSWYYNLNSHFIKDYSQLLWKINKIKFSEFNEVLERDTLILLQDISESNYYTFVDSTNIELNDSIEYQVYLDIDGIFSEKNSKNLKLNFPQLIVENYIPINSHTLYLKWKIDENTPGTVSSVKISNNISGGDIIYESSQNQMEGFIIDTLSNYSNSIIDPGQTIQYLIQWCGESLCDSLNYNAKTFPVSNMQYIPAISNFEFNNSIYSTNAFYIDIYEIDSNLYDNPGQEIESTNHLPVNMVTISDARNYCNLRSSYAYNDLSLTPVYDNQGNYLNDELGFRLPTELEWYVASAIKFDWNNNIFESFPYTLQVGNGVVNCSYANILNCGNALKNVGTYNGSNLPNHQLSFSPNGLYDCNGNVKEWVEKSQVLNHDSNRELLMSGDYLSPPSSALNDYYIYENSGFNHSTIGFRTIIPAEPFLEELIDD